MIKSAVIREVSLSDAQAILDIYTPYILNTAITFEIEIPSLQDFQERIQNTITKYPYFVAVIDNQVVGYTYASAFKGRAAYNWSVETSIYVDQNYRGQGIGHSLYTHLEEALKKQNIHNVCACITYPNPASIAFHESFGFKTIAHFHKAGFKFQTWHDVLWLEKAIHEHTAHPDAFIPYPFIK